jgi:hypothetical protein
VTVVVIFDQLIPKDQEPAFLKGSHLRQRLSVAGQKSLKSLPPQYHRVCRSASAGVSALHASHCARANQADVKPLTRNGREGSGAAGRGHSVRISLRDGGRHTVERDADHRAKSGL